MNRNGFGEMWKLTDVRWTTTQAKRRFFKGFYHNSLEILLIQNFLSFIKSLLSFTHFAKILWNIFQIYLKKLKTFQGFSKKKNPNLYFLVVSLYFCCIFIQLLSLPFHKTKICFPFIL